MIRILVMSGSSVLEVLEDLHELGHDLHHDEDEDAARRRGPRRSGRPRPPDLAVERLVAFLELGQPLEDDFQGPARLAGLDHVDVQAVEGLGRLGHGLGEGGPAFDLVADVDEASSSAPPAWLLLEDLQAAEDRQAGVLEDGQLAGEGGEDLGA